jgi:hypothetical protein
MRGYSNGRDFVLHSSSGGGLLSSKLLHHLPPAVLQPFPLNLLTAQKEGVPLTNDIIVCRCVQMQQKYKTMTNKTSQTNCNGRLLGLHRVRNHVTYATLCTLLKQ